MTDDVEIYCSVVETRIRCCRSKEVAAMLTRLIHTELARKSFSMSDQNRLQKRLQDVIEETFDQDGNNRFLEES
jgi:hypothetical protein